MIYRGNFTTTVLGFVLLYVVPGITLKALNFAAFEVLELLFLKAMPIPYAYHRAARDELLWRLWQFIGQTAEPNSTSVVPPPQINTVCGKCSFPFEVDAKFCEEYGSEAC
jgi:hypothetical protein